MRVAFFGSSRLSCLVLKALLQSPHEVAVVITQPDQPAGRAMALTPTHLCVDALDAGLPVLKPERVRSNPRFRAELMEHKPEAFMVTAYGQIISKKVLALVQWPLNVHPSLLPRLRGASPMRTALLQGLKCTGCCVMKMTPRLDDGDILLREEINIPLDWDHGELEDAMGGLGGRLALQALDSVASGSVKLTPQDEEAATYCSTYTRADTWIDWSRPAARLYDFIRAWSPDIGACTNLPDGKRLKIWQATTQQPPGEEKPEVYADAPPGNAAPGTVLTAAKMGLWVNTGDGALRIVELQPENRARMSAASFLAGRRLKAGDRLGAGRAGRRARHP
ncbi:methionyl-tRNA formyltransferase [bacterium]|nr:methionyl-tRNA formyltransferase [bacterium]